MQIEIGDKIKDNDPRMTNRVLIVVALTDTHVVCENDSYRHFPKVKIRKDRIYSDNKKRRSGFDLVA